MKNIRFHSIGIVFVFFIIFSACAQISVQVEVFDPLGVKLRERPAQTNYRSLLTILINENEKVNFILKEDVPQLRDQLLDIQVECQVSAKQPEIDTLRREAAGKAKEITDIASTSASEIKKQADLKARETMENAHQKAELLIKDVMEKLAPAIIHKAEAQAQELKDKAKDKPKAVQDQAEKEAERIIREAQARKNHLIKDAEERKKTNPDQQCRGTS